MDNFDDYQSWKDKYKLLTNVLEAILHNHGRELFLR